MEWAKPKHSKGKIDRAGQALIGSEQRAASLMHSGSGDAFSEHIEAHLDALEIINNHRACHNYPLNTFKVTLRRYASKVDRNYVVAQRIKRLSSIRHKLERYSSLRLSQMQDIGGCRAIVTNLKDVHALVKKYEKSDIKHIHDDKDDYIAQPKPSGYRGIHLIYKYKSDKDAPSVYNGLYIEIQIRSRLQHAWATAVETVGTFLNQPLKSSFGEEKWLRFFAVMGSVIAIQEGSALVPNTPTAKTPLIKELRQITGELNVTNSLKMFGDALKVGEQAPNKNHHYFLLKLEANEQKMTVTSFPLQRIAEASQRYLEIEQEIAGVPGADAVLVSVDSLTALKRAYPNYFLDTQIFLELLKESLKR